MGVASWKKGASAEYSTWLLVASLAMAVGGCSTTPFAGETSALNNAANEFKVIVAGDGPVSSARTSASKARLIEFLAGGSIPPFNNCSAATAAAANFDANVAQNVAEAAEQSYLALLKSPSCGWDTSLEPNASTATTPPILQALNDYYAGVAAIASASSVQQVVDATKKTTAAVAALSNFVPIPGAAAAVTIAGTLIDKIAQYGLQTAQYRALEMVLGNVDPLLDSAEGPIISALRIQQGNWIAQVSNFAGDGTSALQSAFTKVAGDTQLRFALYQASQPILDDLAADQRAVRTDPANGFHTLVTAHHKLYAALRANKGQLTSILGATEDLAGSAQALTGSAVAPATAAKASAETGGVLTVKPTAKKG